MFVSNAYAVPTPAAGALRRSDAINIIYSINFYELRGQNVV